MTSITPREFFAALYPDPIAPGQLLLRSTIRRSGRQHSDWCYNPRQAARLVEHYLRTRSLRFGVALQDRRKALSLARRRRPRVTAARVVGGEGSVTALPALWAEVGVADPGAPGAALPGDRRSALALFAAVCPPPSILVWTGSGFDAYWPLDPPWVLKTAEHRADARGLLRKLQWALQQEAAGEGWQVDRPADLARLARVPGSFYHRGRRRLSVTLEQFPLVGVAAGGRYAVGDFAALDEPPAAESRERPWDSAAAGAAAADFRGVWEGCSWLRHAYHDRAALPEAEWRAALSIAGRCRVPGLAAAGIPAADGGRLAQRFSAGHPGYSPEVTAEELGRLLRRSAGAATCSQIAARFAAWAEHCGRCPHQGRLDSPLDLGRADPAGETPAPAGTVEAPAPRSDAGETPAAQRAADPAAARSDLAAAAEVPAALTLLAGLVRSEIVRQGLAVGASGASPAPRRADAGVLELFVEGLDELLADLGGQATAREMVAALAADAEGRRFGSLRSALGRLFPRLSGGLPTPRELGYKLRAFADRPAGGRTIVHARKSSPGVTWAVRSAAP